jgi:hypothetical protein
LRYGSRFSNKFHRNKLFNIELTNNGSCFGTVRFALLRKTSVQTVERYNLNHGRVRAFKQKSRKTVKKERYAVRSTKRSLPENGRVRYGSPRYGTVRYGTLRYGTLRYGTLRYATVRYGHGRRINSDSLL